MVSAQKRAFVSTFGLQLGLEDLIFLDWCGQENMTWTMLVPTIQKLVAKGQAPDVLVFHLRGDDLVYTMEFGLFITLKKTLLQLRELLPQVKIIWSEIIPQGIWHGVKRLEQREKLNTAVGKSFQSYGGSVIPHPRFSPDDSELYTDKANLSPAGLDVFLEDIQNGILDHLGQPRRAVRPQLNKATRPPSLSSPAGLMGLASASQKVTIREDEVLSSKEELSQQTIAGEAAVSFQPETSGPRKTENTDGEQKLVPESFPPCPGK